MRAGAVVLSLVLAGCGGGSESAPPTAVARPDPAAYAPLDVGADWATYTKVNRASFVSPTHGGRVVDVWVNQVGAGAYQGEGPIPVGTVVVKTSHESVGGQPTDVAGPVFVMEKRAPGFDPEHGDWWYGLHWAKVPPSWVERMGAGQIYWRSPSPRVAYCWNCHDAFDRELGLPPPDQRIAPSR